MQDKFANITKEYKEKHFNKLIRYRDELRRNPELRALFIEMTISCNQHCLHCGSSCGDVTQTGSLTDDEIFNFLKKLKMDLEQDNKPLPFIAITGGEPLLRKNLPELMKQIHNELGYTWGMTSNALLATPEMCHRLKEAGMYSIGVSLDGLEGTHDWFRQSNGSYKKTIENIRNLVAEGFKNVMVTTVVHKRNINELDAIKEVVKEIGIDTWRIVGVDPIGRTLENKDILLDGNSDYRYIIDYITNLRETDNDIDVIYSCNHYLGLEFERKVRSWYYLCCAGIKVAGIQYNGDIGACLDIQRDSSLVFGNIRKDNFYDVWKNKFEIFRMSKFEKSEKCRKCADRLNCDGNGWHTWDFDLNEPKLCMKELINNKDV